MKNQQQISCSMQEVPPSQSVCTAVVEAGSFQGKCCVGIFHISFHPSLSCKNRVIPRCMYYNLHLIPKSADRKHKRLKFLHIKQRHSFYPVTYFLHLPAKISFSEKVRWQFSQVHISIVALIKNKTAFSQLPAASKSPFCTHQQPTYEKG